ncbi:MAG TPA: hypothetical protein VE990_03875 [Acidimicrobiales bacterium]|nr:hypothetical protein [Acidimicrobiales bacterium]
MSDVPEADAQEQSELADRSSEASSVVLPASRAADVPVDDAIEQATEVAPKAAGPSGGRDLEAPEADWIEQEIEEPYEDDDGG